MNHPGVKSPVWSVLCCGLSTFGARTTLAEEQSLTLDVGWNVISVQVLPSPATPELVFADPIRKGVLRSVWGFHQGSWLCFSPGRPPEFCTLRSISPLRGYYVEVSRAATVHLEGEKVAAADLELSGGWNLIGIDSLSEARPAQRFVNAGATEILGLGSLSPFEIHSHSRGDLASLVAGRGYWVHARQPVLVSLAGRGPMLRLSSTRVRLRPGGTTDVFVRNVGDQPLRWSGVSTARWVCHRHGIDGARTTRRFRIVDSPISSTDTIADDGTPLAVLSPGEVFRVFLEGDSTGLPPRNSTTPDGQVLNGTYEDEIQFVSDEGTYSLAVVMDVHELNLAGRWAGIFTRGAGSLEASSGLALEIQQNGTQLVATIDGRFSPAFVTALSYQAGRHDFRRGGGSFSDGSLRLSQFEDLGEPFRWSLKAKRPAPDGPLLFDLYRGTEVDLFRDDPDPPPFAEDLEVGVPYRPSDVEGVFALEILPSRTKRDYQAGDQFDFETGSFGHTPVELQGQVTTVDGEPVGSLVGDETLDGEFLGIPAGVVRTLRFEELKLQGENVLVGSLTVEHSGLLRGEVVRTAGRVVLSLAE